MFSDSVPSPIHSSVAVNSEAPCFPPIAKPEVCVPAPAKSSLDVLIEFSLVQLVPFQDSAAAEFGGANPPKANDEVLSAPAPAKFCLAVFKSFTSVQLVPL